MMVSKESVYDCLKHYFGFDKFKGDQELVVENSQNNTEACQVENVDSNTTEVVQ